MLTGSIRRTCTAGPACTSTSSSASCAGWSTSTSTASAPRGRARWRTRRRPALAGANAALQTIGVDLEIAEAVAGCDVLHSHTWYANLAGLLGGLLHGVPHVVTAHSLEPQRPWKAEQLGGGYRLSSWAERTAYRNADAVIAVSRGMRADVLAAYPDVDPDKVHVVHNGIDTGLYQPDRGTDVLERLGVDPDRPYVVFVGRITRQKGVGHLLAAARAFEPEAQLVLCAGAPDTPEIGAATAAAVEALRETRSGVVWISEMLPRPDVVQLLTQATVFVCPSVYEPLGIVNLEAMACETAVVASEVGGIPEVVATGETGMLVPYTATTEGFEAGLADAVNALVPTRSGRPRWGAPAARGRCASSAGTRWRGGPWRSTARSAERSRRGGSGLRVSSFRHAVPRCIWYEPARKGDRQTAQGGVVGDGGAAAGGDLGEAGVPDQRQAGAQQPVPVGPAGGADGELEAGGPPAVPVRRVEGVPAELRGVARPAPSPCRRSARGAG